MEKMKRHIQFKAKRIIGREWVYGYYAMLGENDLVKHYIIQNMALAELFENPEKNMCFNDVLIDVNSLCEYTGMKDKNDKEIYESDIVRFINERGIIYLAKIVYKNAQFKCIWENKVNYLTQNLDYWVRNEQVEVIDNIHDCPDFIERMWSE
jgi:uncharacterized phage protein (TIGR01671 family)